jgi:hypothetical protein
MTNLSVLERNVNTSHLLGAGTTISPVVAALQFPARCQLLGRVSSAE